MRLHGPGSGCVADQRRGKSIKCLLSALYIPTSNQLYPVWIPATGLVACGALAFFVEPWIWITGVGLIAVGLAWYGVAHWRRGGSLSLS